VVVEARHSRLTKDALEAVHTKCWENWSSSLSDLKKELVELQQGKDTSRDKSTCHCCIFFQLAMVDEVDAVATVFIYDSVITFKAQLYDS